MTKHPCTGRQTLNHWIIKEAPQSAGFDTEKPENSGFPGVRAKTEGETEKQRKTTICQGTKTDMDLGKISPALLPVSDFIHLKIELVGEKVVSPSYSSTILENISV